MVFTYKRFASGVPIREPEAIGTHIALLSDMESLSHTVARDDGDYSTGEATASISPAELVELYLKVAAIEGQDVKVYYEDYGAYARERATGNVWCMFFLDGRLADPRPVLIALLNAPIDSRDKRRVVAFAKDFLVQGTF